MRLSKAGKLIERQPACILCGNHLYRRLFNVGTTKIVSCRSCGLTKTEGSKGPDYHRYHRDEDYQKDEWLYRNFFQKRLQNIQKYHSKPGRVLDVGCSTGILLTLFKDMNWEVWGVEPSKSGEVARRKGIRVVRRPFERASLPENHFDVVVLNHTLEHLDNPVIVLQKARRLLRQEGIVSVDVPNFGALSSRIMGRRWGYLTPEEHCWHFTPKTLEGVFRKANLKVIHQETASGILDCGSPLKGLIGKLLHGRKGFFVDLLAFPFAYLYSKIGLGANLTIIGKK